MDLKTCIDNRDIEALRRLKLDKGHLYVMAKNAHGMFFYTSYTPLQYALCTMIDVTNRIEEFIVFFDELVVVLGNDINYTGSGNTNCLYYAIQYGVDYRIIEHIVKKYPQTINFVNSKSIVPQTVLYDQLFKAVTKNDLKVVKLLVDSGVEVNRKYMYGYTIGHIIIEDAVRLNNAYEMLKYIVNSVRHNINTVDENVNSGRYNINAVNVNQDNNLLHELAVNTNNTPWIVSQKFAVFLVNNGVSTAALNINRQSPLSLLVSRLCVFGGIRLNTPNEIKQYCDLVITLISADNVNVDGVNVIESFIIYRRLHPSFLVPIFKKILEFEPNIENNRFIARLDNWVEHDHLHVVESSDNEGDDDIDITDVGKANAHKQMFMLFMSHGAKKPAGFEFGKTSPVSEWFAKQYTIVLNNIAIMSAKEFPRLVQRSPLSEVDKDLLKKLLGLM